MVINVKFEPMNGGATYTNFIESYWEWLLGTDPDSSQPAPGNVTYMRANYQYGERWRQPAPPAVAGMAAADPPSRKNTITEYPTPGIPGSSQGLAIPHNVLNVIFLPVIDSMLGKTDFDEDGNPMPNAIVENILESENNEAVNCLISPTIEKLSPKPEPRQEILSRDQLLAQRSPRYSFQLNVPPNSKLASKMEDAIPAGLSDQVTVQGFYLKFTIGDPGMYIVESHARGVRGYRADMRYYFKVEP